MTYQIPAPLVKRDDVCPACRGMGWLRQNLPLGHPDWGKPVKCICSVSLDRAREAARTYSWLGASVDLSHQSFVGYQAHLQPDAYQYMVAYADQLVFGGKVGNVLLIGDVGTGKTHLAAATLNQMRAAGKPGLFCTAPGLFRALYAATLPEQDSLINRASETPLLVIDDLDSLYIKAREDKAEEGKYQKDMLYDILGARYASRLATIITANVGDLSPWLDDKTISRVLAGCKILEMNGPDYRLIEKR